MIYVASKQQEYTEKEFRGHIVRKIEDIYMNNGFNANEITATQVAEEFEQSTYEKITMPVNALLMVQEEVSKFVEKYGI